MNAGEPSVRRSAAQAGWRRVIAPAPRRRHLARDDRLGPARGILLGAAISLVLWALLATLAWAIV